MKYKIFLSFLISMNSFTRTCDENTKFIINARTDQNDVTSIKSIRYPENLDDTMLHEILTRACSLATLIAHNNILNLPQPVPCISLRNVDFSNGNIKEFCIGDWITAMPNLQTLTLSHNKISSIASDLDTEQSTCGPCGQQVRLSWSSNSLQRVDLSHNELTEFDLNIPNNATNLTIANFSHNKIAKIIIPKSLNHRKRCKIILQNNELNSTDQNLLEKCNVHDTKEYENSTQCCLNVVSVVSSLSGMGSTVGIIFGVTNHTDRIDTILPVFFLGIGNVFAHVGTGLLLGHAINRCKTHKTYQPFNFIFDDKTNKDHVAIQLEQF